MTFIELPEASVLTPGLAPGFFFVTPKLTGCNIFVAYDKGLRFEFFRFGNQTKALLVSLKGNHFQKD